LQRVVASTAAAGLVREGALPLRAESSAPKGGPYIDVHTHVGRTWTGDPPLSPDDLVRWMGKHNIAKAVVLPLVSPESSNYLNLTDQALDAAHKHPTRLVPFCCIDPRTSYAHGKEGLKSMVKEYIDRGARGFGEHKAGLPIDHPKMIDLYEVCDDLKLPVLFHMDQLRGTDVPGLPGLEKVLRTLPNAQFIGHGPGFWASISGGLGPDGLGIYPKGAVQPGGALDRLFDTYPNLWGDLSAGSGANALSRDLKFGKGFLERRADRLMFGTDYLKVGQGVPQFDLLANFRLAPEILAKIERGNAQKLLGLSL
jgi:predicted TIM-barrel fold metal-dependent hydrolase